MGHRPTLAGIARRIDSIGNGNPARRDGRVVVDRVIERLVRWWCSEIGGMQAKDVQDIVRVDRPARIGHCLRDPARLALAFGFALVDLSAPRIGHDEPHQPGADDEPDDQQPPVELGVHVARVQGSAAGTPRRPPRN
jgi:hypothetical protein